MGTSSKDRHDRGVAKPSDGAEITGPQPADAKTSDAKTTDAKTIDAKTIDARIGALAFPALGALVAEPLFLLVDSALVGHLGAAPLAGLAVASSVLQTVVGLMVFLAYSTTPLVARRRGAGDERGAVQAGIDGLWLALGLGAAVALALWALTPTVVTAFGAGTDVSEQAERFLAISCAGVPAMLLVFAATGLLRGLQDTRTPLVIATIGFGVNALLNWWFIYGLRLGIGGSALGTVLAQWGMVAVYLVVISRHASRVGASLKPQAAGLRYAGRSGGWLFVRTIGLRAAILSTVFAATVHGTVTTAGYQIAFTLFSTAAFALDALAIAAQALIGDALGARDPNRVRLIVRRTVHWGVLSGVLIGALLAAGSGVLGRMFTSDERVLSALPLGLLLLAASLPIGALVFALDGVLMGAGDMRYLAWTSMLNLAVYAPVLWIAATLPQSSGAALAAITAAYGFGFMLARLGTLGARSLRLARDPLAFE